MYQCIHFVDRHYNIKSKVYIANKITATEMTNNTTKNTGIPSTLSGGASSGFSQTLGLLRLQVGIHGA